MVTAPPLAQNQALNLKMLTLWLEKRFIPV